MGYGPGVCMHKLISKNDIPDDNLIKSYLNDLINCYDNLLENDVSSNLRKVFQKKIIGLLPLANKLHIGTLLDFKTLFLLDGKLETSPNLKQKRKLRIR